MKWKKLAALLGFLSLAVAMAGGASLYIFRIQLIGFSRAPMTEGEYATIPVVVPKGASTKEIAKLLAEKGVISDATMFVRYVRFVAENPPQLKAGEYELSPGMSPQEIIKELELGRQAEIRFTVPEGLRKEEVADIIAAAGFGTRGEVLTAMNDPALRKSFGVPDTGAGGQDSVPGGVEGYLYPDTYQFPKNTPPERIINRMRMRLDEVLDQGMKDRMTKMGWDLHRTLTLAAIIEKETGQPSERPHISSVFHNRLDRGMKLQTDPTVIYAIPDYSGNIRKSDLLREHPYNTYVIPGLPPGPIAQPGKAAIRAALFPTKDDDVFFVSRNDGGHIFCPDLACHNAAVQKWQVEFFQKRKDSPATPE